VAVKEHRLSRLEIAIDPILQLLLPIARVRVFWQGSPTCNADEVNHTPPSPVEQRLHCAYRQSQCGGGLGAGLVFHVKQGDHLAVARWQGVK
jgi:hypothetical protein